MAVPHAEGTPGPRASALASVISAHLGPHRQPEAPEPPRPEPSPTQATRVAADPPPAATDTRRMATRQANRQTQPREHRPHPRSRSVPASPPDRVPLARQNAPGYFWSRHPTSMSSLSSEPTCCTGYSAAPNDSGRRSAAPASAVAVRNPPRSSAAIGSPGPPPPAVRTRRDVPSRRRPGPEPRCPHHIFPVDDAVGLNAAACSTPHRAHRAERRSVVRHRHIRPARIKLPQGYELRRRRNVIECVTSPACADCLFPRLAPIPSHGFGSK